MSTGYVGPGGVWIQVQDTPNQGSVSGAGNTAVTGKYKVSGPIFWAPLRVDTTQLIPESSQITVNFSRAFNLSVLLPTGLYSVIGNQVAAFSYVPAAQRGMLSGSSAASSLIYSAGGENRDLTLAAWTKTTITAAKNATGLDGSANVASSLTATAGLAKCLFTTTGGATARTFQAHVRRKAGYGRVWMTVDNGISWQDITPLMTPVYKQFTLPVTTANPTVGFMLEVSGDAIEVDAVNCVQSAYVVPPMIDAGYSTYAQTLTYTNARPSDSAPAFELEYQLLADTSFAAIVSLTNGANAQLILAVISGGSTGLPTVQFINAAGTLIYNGASNWFASTPQVTPGTVCKLKMRYAGGSIYAFVNGALSSIFDSNLTPTTRDITGFTNVEVKPSIGNYISDVVVSEWYGKIVTLLGDSISAVEAYRQNMLAAVQGDCQVLLKGTGGDTVALVRDRIAADLIYAMPASNECHVILWVGTNTLCLNIDAATALAQLQTAVNNILAINANAKITLVSCITYRSAFLTGITQAAFKTAAEAYNVGQAAMPGIFKYVELNSAATTVSTFYSDGLHPKYKNYPYLCRAIAAGAGLA